MTLAPVVHWLQWSTPTAASGAGSACIDIVGVVLAKHRAIIDAGLAPGDVPDVAESRRKARAPGRQLSAMSGNFFPIDGHPKEGRRNTGRALTQACVLLSNRASAPHGRDAEQADQAAVETAYK